MGLYTDNQMSSVNGFMGRRLPPQKRPVRIHSLCAPSMREFHKITAGCADTRPGWQEDRSADLIGPGSRFVALRVT